jgi:hypothetical protein
MKLFRPAYLDVLTFHEIDGGKVAAHDIRLLERAGAGIAADYREVTRKLRAVEGIDKPRPRRNRPSLSII